jgi:hypothetical protein
MQRLKFVLAGLLCTSTAFAQGDGTTTDPPAGGDGTGEGAMVGSGGDGSGKPIPLVGAGSLNPAAKGKITITGSTVQINLSADAVGKPIAFAPSIYYGIDDKLAIGLTHDGGTTPITPRPGIGFATITIPPIPPLPAQTITVPTFGGICITGEENGCIDVYGNVGVDGIYALKDDKFSIAAHGGLDAFSLDPFVLSLRAGVLGRYMLADKMSLVFDPRLRIGITERDANKEVIDVPAWFWFSATPELSAYLHTGIWGPLDGFGDAFIVPVQVGANYDVNANLTAGLDFSFVNLLGNGGDADGRVLVVRGIYRI